MSDATRSRYCTYDEQSTRQCFETEAERDALDLQVILKRADERAASDKKQAEWQAEADRQARERTEEREQREAERQAARDEEDRRLALELRERAAFQEAEAARRIELRKMATDPTYAIPAVSAIICDLEAQVHAYRKDMQREHDLTAQSGVMDLANRRQIAESIRSAQDEIQEWKQTLRARHKSAPRSCTSVRGVLTCHQDAAVCSDSDKIISDIWTTQQDVLSGDYVDTSTFDQALKANSESSQ